MRISFISYRNSKLVQVLFGALLFLLIQGNANADETNLVSAMELTLQNNEDLLSKKYKLNADAEQVEQAWARVKPTITARAIKGRSEYSTELSDDESRSYQRLNLDITQPIFSRKLFLGIDRSELALKSQESMYSLEQKSKLIETAQAYMDVLKFQEAVRISELELNDHEQRLKQLEAMLERGLTSKVDLLEAQSRYDVLRSNLVRDRNDFRISRKALERIIGISVRMVTPIDPQIWDRATSILTVKSKNAFYELSARKSPSIAAAQTKLFVSEKDVEVSKAEYWPELSMRLSVGDSDTYETSVQQDKKIQFELNIPIYEGGMTSSRVAAANYELSSQKFFLEDQKRFVQFKMDEVFARLEGSVANIEALEKTKASNQAYLKSAQKGLTFGLRGVYDVLEAKAQGYDVERRLIFEKYDNILAQIEFLYLIGKLSPSSLADYLKPNYSLSALSS